MFIHKEDLEKARAEFSGLEQMVKTLDETLTEPDWLPIFDPLIKLGLGYP